MWVCGHSHEAKKIVIDKCLCWINPLGYSMEQTGFDKYESIENVLKTLPL